jgi:hypothetical protein
VSPAQLALPLGFPSPPEVPRAPDPPPPPAPDPLASFFAEAVPAVSRPAAVVALERRLDEHVVETPEGPRTWLSIVAESCAAEPGAIFDVVLEGAGERADGGAGKIVNGWDRAETLPSRHARDRAWYELARVGKLRPTQIAAVWGVHLSVVARGIRMHTARMNLAARVPQNVIASSRRGTG